MTTPGGFTNRALLICALVLCGALLTACVEISPEAKQFHVARAAYASAERTAISEGKLRTERSPADVPFTNADLVRNFEKIALAHQTLYEGEPAPTELMKWDGAVTYRIAGNGSEPIDQTNLRELIDRLTLRTDLQFEESTPGTRANIDVLIAKKGLRKAVVGLLSRSSDLEQRQDLKNWESNPESPCFGLSGLAAEAPDEAQQQGFAIIFVKAETSEGFRKNCLHRQIAGALGLRANYDGARPSIFNDDGEFALLTEHDEHLLRILYDPRLKRGMSADQAMPIVRQIVAEIGPG